MKINKYHKFVFKYMLKNGEVKGVYEFAKADGHINNRIEYRNALNDLNQEKMINITNEGDSSIYSINFGKFEFLKENGWKEFFLINDNLLDYIFDNEKLTFLDWMEHMKKLPKIMVESGLKDMLNKAGKKGNQLKQILKLLKVMN